MDKYQSRAAFKRKTPQNRSWGALLYLSFCYSPSGIFLPPAPLRIDVEHEIRKPYWQESMASWSKGLSPPPSFGPYSAPGPGKGKATTNSSQLPMNNPSDLLTCCERSVKSSEIYPLPIFIPQVCHQVCLFALVMLGSKHSSRWCFPIFPAVTTAELGRSSNLHQQENGKKNGNGFKYFREAKMTDIMRLGGS